jgi:hypothetical protein
MPGRTYHIEHFVPVTVREYLPETLKERTGPAWVPVDEITTDESWQVFEVWFATLPEDRKRAGRYRVIWPFAAVSGGTYSEYEVKPSWSVDRVRKPVEEASVVAPVA